MTKAELITNLKAINIEIFTNIGGQSKFKKQYPNYIEYVNQYSQDIVIYSSNSKLFARLLFLVKYDGDLSKITKNKKLMIYDYKINDFKEAYINAAQKQWNTCNLELLKISELYSLEETKQLLIESQGIYFGKSGNRKLLKNNKRLYLSLYSHTSFMDELDQNLNKLSSRIYILCNNINIMCDKHNNLKHWRFANGMFKICCSMCEPKYPSKDWFIKKYGDHWIKHNMDRREKLSKLKANSLNWFIAKYGDVVGIEKYSLSVVNRINNLVNLKNNKYSKISQVLFNEIYNRINDKNNIYYYELNKEFVIQIPKEYNYTQTVMIVDFIKDKKIIEYNGKYWHNEELDNKRYEILRDLGYEVFVVKSDDFNRSHKDEKIINNCLNYLSC